MYPIPTPAPRNHLALAQQLAAAEQARMAPTVAPQPAAKTNGLFGLRKPNPEDRKALGDDILSSEMRSPVKHWSQALMRPLMGLIKTQQDARAREYGETKKAEKADALVSALAGVRSGMNEQGEVDLGTILAGVRDPELIDAIVGYADKAGDDRFRRFDSGRRFDRGVFENDRRFNAGRDDEDWRRGHSDRTFKAGRDDEDYRRGRLDRQDEAYGDPKPAEDAQGNPVYIQLNSDGTPREMPGGYKPPRSGMEFNRKLTPAEVAKNREILAARNIIANRIAENGREDVIGFSLDDDTADLLKTARQSLVGAEDRGYEAFIETLTGTKATPAPAPTLNQSDNAVEGKSAPRLLNTGTPDPVSIPDQGGLMPRAPAAKPIVEAVPQEQDTLMLGHEVSPFPGVQMVPMLAPGQPDIKSMVPGRSYQFVDKTGKTKTIKSLGDGKFELVGE